MYNMGMVRISTVGRRPSFFDGSLSDNFGGAAPGVMAGSYHLGQTPEEWYARAKSAVADFDNYANRVQHLANKTERDRIARDYGLTNPGDKDKAQYMRNDVQQTISQVESYSPPNYLIYAVGQRSMNHVRALEDFNNDFRREVNTAENTYGVLPEPQVIEKVVTVPGAAGAVNWTLPIVIGGAAIGVAALLGLFGGGK